MVHAVSEYTTRFTTSSHRYIQTRQIRQDMDNFFWNNEKWFENQSNQGHMAEAMQWLSEMLRQVNPCD
jgi:hypothetical protein